ncbi:MAG: hypothetical protein WCI60_02895 [bacterium]
MATKKTKKKVSGFSGYVNKKNLIRLGIVLVLLAGVFAVLVFTNTVTFGKSQLKTITYNNGDGSSFNLKFYNEYTLKNRPFSSNPNSMELVSKVSVKGKRPLVLWIKTHIGLSALYPKYTKNNCASKSSLPKAFNARVDYIKSSVPVCVIKGPTNKDILYLVTFHDSKNGYLVYIAQDANFAYAATSPMIARDFMARTGLEDYRNDIKTILASLKPIN